jgi:lipopolysaccharide exporter
VLSAFFSTGVVGQYALCSRVLRLPLGLIGSNIARVFSQRAAEARHQGSLTELTENVFGYLVALGMFPFLVLAMVGKDLFSVAFGPRWADAGLYAQILSIWAFFWFISTSLAVVLDVVEEQAFELRTNLLLFITRTGSLVVGCKMGNPRIALEIFAVTDAVICCYYCFAIMHRCGASVKKLLGVLLSSGLMFVPAGLIILGLRYFDVPRMIVLASSTALIGLYYVALFHVDPQVRLVMGAMIQRFLPQRMTAN